MDNWTHLLVDMGGQLGDNLGVQVISDEEAKYFFIVNYDIVSCAIALFGVIANAMNIVVFFKQGFDNTVNISFFGLAICDLCSLITMMWLCVCINPLFESSDISMVPREIMHLTAGVPHICFVRITGWITVYVTAERCLCITMPLKIKQIITPKVTTLTITFIYLLNILSYVPEYVTSYIAWNFYPHRNRTLLGLAFTSDRKNTEGLVFVLYSILGFASFVAVIVFTVLLVVQLKQKSKWRSKVNADKTRSESISNRDRKTMSMVVMIATVLIVCYTPGVVISLTTFIESEFIFLGLHRNAFFVSWSFAFIFEAVNSSVNIFVYYRMSTKYRETFNVVFGFRKTTESGTTSHLSYSTRSKT